MFGPRCAVGLRQYTHLYLAGRIEFTCHALTHGKSFLEIADIAVQRLAHGGEGR